MTAHTNESSVFAVLRAVQTSVFDRIAQALELSNLNLSRREQIEALQGKSDHELARIGVRRDQIAYHVYNDLFYS